MLYEELTNSIISSFYKVHYELGPGLLELPYHNALFLDLRKKGIDVKSEFPLPVFFEGEQVGEYYADLLVEDKVIIEVKSVSGLDNSHRAQILNYLRISGCKVGLLVNFHPVQVCFKRIVL